MAGIETAAASDFRHELRARVNSEGHVVQAKITFTTLQHRLCEVAEQMFRDADCLKSAGRGNRFTVTLTIDSEPEVVLSGVEP